jgi:hypothetical protein
MMVELEAWFAGDKGQAADRHDAYRCVCVCSLCI